MKKILKNLVTTTALICSLSSSALASSAVDNLDLGQYRTAASNLSHQIGILISNVQSNFKTGATDTEDKPCTNYVSQYTNANMMNDTNGNPYIEKAILNPDCSLQITLVDNANAKKVIGIVENNAGVGVGGASPLPRSWFNKEIIMVPIYNNATGSTDTTISAWECVTDISNDMAKIDKQANTLGQTGARSALAVLSGSGILGNCIYTATPSSK